MKRCSTCAAGNPDDAQTCGVCGTPFQEVAEIPALTSAQLLASLEAAYASRNFLQKSKAEAVPEEVRQILNEIEEEFAFKIDTNANLISDLEAQLRESVAASGEKVIGAVYQVIPVKGKTTWKADVLDGLAIVIPEILKAKKVGKPSAQIRKIGDSE